jgi:hypothetical protein
VQYRDGVIYRVMPDGAHRREDGGRVGKAAIKRQKKARRLERSQVKRTTG